jgi:hypothetical protein
MMYPAAPFCTIQVAWTLILLYPQYTPQMHPPMHPSMDDNVRLAWYAAGISETRTKENHHAS